MFDPLLPLLIIPGLPLLQKDWVFILCLLLVNRKPTVLPDLSIALGQITTFTLWTRKWSLNPCCFMTFHICIYPSLYGWKCTNGAFSFKCYAGIRWISINSNSRWKKRWIYAGIAKSQHRLEYYFICFFLWISGQWRIKMKSWSGITSFYTKSIFFCIKIRIIIKP